MNFSGKNIWITGASSGIGRAVALQLSNDQPTLILSGRNEEALQQTAALCEKNGCKTLIIPFDLGNETSVNNAVKILIEKGIVPQCLYLFGGISQRSLALETPLNIDRKLFEVNFFGTIALTKAILPLMIKNGGGHIAVTSSIVGKFGFPWRSAYSASKHALHGFYESLRAENSKFNIAVSVIIPGRIRTAISINAIEKSGKMHGKMDEGQAKGMNPDTCAKQIYNGLRKEKKEILVGGKEIIMVYIRKYIPSLYYILAAKVKPL